MHFRNNIDFGNAVELIWANKEKNGIWNYLDKDIDYHSYDGEENIYCYNDLGIELTFSSIDGEHLLTSIVLYLKPTHPNDSGPGYQPFLGVLPCGFSAETTKDDVFKILGVEIPRVTIFTFAHSLWMSFTLKPCPECISGERVRNPRQLNVTSLQCKRKHVPDATVQLDRPKHEVDNEIYKTQNTEH